MNGQEVTADAATLMKHAGYTAEAYLIDAIEHIDKHLGKGFAKQHPELIGQYMLTAAADFHAASTLIAGHNVRDALAGIAASIDCSVGFPTLVREAAAK